MVMIDILGDDSLTKSSEDCVVKEEKIEIAQYELELQVVESDSCKKESKEMMFLFLEL
jgi:hypothetical protein